MRTFPIHDASGRIRAFEVENAYIGATRLADVLAPVDGVSAVHVGPGRGDPSDVRVRFTFRGRTCVAFEPWGDNSRYWVGPEDPEAAPFDAGPLDAAVRAYRPPWPVRLLGDLVSLRIPFRSPA